MFWDLVTPAFKVGVLSVGLRPLLLKEKLQVLSSFSIVGPPAKGRVYGEMISQLLLPTLMWFPLSLSNVQYSLNSFQVFSEYSVPYVAVNSVCQ